VTHAIVHVTIHYPPLVDDVIMSYQIVHVITFSHDPTQHITLLVYHVSYIKQLIILSTTQTATSDIITYNAHTKRTLSHCMGRSKRLTVIHDSYIKDITTH